MVKLGRWARGGQHAWDDIAVRLYWARTPSSTAIADHPGIGAN